MKTRLALALLVGAIAGFALTFSPEALAAVDYYPIEKAEKFTGPIVLAPSAYKAAPSVSTGNLFSVSASTFTDNSTAASGTATSDAFFSIAQPTLSATNMSVATTDAATFYIANAPANGTNESITHPHALWVAAGDSKFSGTLTAGGGVLASGSTSNDFSGSTGTFKTSTGAVTLGGANSAVTSSTGTAATNITATAATAGAGLHVGATRVITRNASVAPVDATGGITATVTQLLDAGIFTAPGTATIVMPTFQGSSGVIQNLPGTPAVGDLFSFEIACSHATQVVTITPGTGQTLFGIATTAPGGGSRTWQCRVTSVTANSETATCY